MPSGVNPRVCRWRQSALSGSLHADAQMTGNDGNGGATAMSASSLQLGGLLTAPIRRLQQQHCLLWHAIRPQSRPNLEPQRISNMHLQPSPPHRQL